MLYVDFRPNGGDPAGNLQVETMEEAMAAIRAKFPRASIRDFHWDATDGHSPSWENASVRVWASDEDRELDKGGSERIVALIVNLSDESPERNAELL